MSAKFDIFMRQSDGQPVWIKAVESLEEAKRQLMELNDRAPAEYFVFSAISGKVVLG